MELFHRTTAANAAAIVRDGFEDGEGYYMTDQLHRGVWLLEIPVDCGEGSKGDVLLSLRITKSVIAKFA